MRFYMFIPLPPGSVNIKRVKQSSQNIKRELIRMKISIYSAVFRSKLTVPQSIANFRHFVPQNTNTGPARTKMLESKNSQIANLFKTTEFYLQKQYYHVIAHPPLTSAQSMQK